MSPETMTAKERVAAALRVEKPDRVPVVPLLPPEPVAQLAGFTKGQVALDVRQALTAFLKAFDDFGGWDGVYGGPITPLQMQANNIYPMRMRIPGKDLPDDYIFQLVEEEIMTLDDYDRIREMGIDEFYFQDYIHRIGDLSPEDVSRASTELATTGLEFLAELGKRDTPMLFFNQELHPFFRLSLMRSLLPFTQDLYYRPDVVEEAIQRITKDLIAKQLPLAKMAGIGAWMLVEERASGYHYPPAIFERFWWPYTKEIVEAFWSEGIVTLFHLDTCWDKNLQYFRELPRGCAIVGLDGTTDIFLAKEILGGHLCLYGDIPASLFSIGQPEEVTAYCRRLIDEVGRDGGFILGSGCAVAADCKPENFRAMLETGKNYEFSKG
jgi:hypothetical protein